MLSYYEQLTNEEKLLVNSEVQNEGKNPVVAYLFWFFLGTYGAHNFYLGRKSAAMGQLLLAIFGWLTIWLLIGGFVLAFVGIWAFIDLFRISNFIKDSNEGSREQKAYRILTLRQEATGEPAN